MLKLNAKTKKAFKEACEKTGRPESIDFSGLPEDMRDQSEADYMLKVITEAKNDGWKADWNNPNQRKWFPYFGFFPFGCPFRLFALPHFVCGCGSRGSPLLQR